MLNEIEALLERTVGLDVASVGISVVEHAVRLRQSACNLADLAGYWDHLRRSEAELQELIDAVVVSETWFFRDRSAFDAMSRVVVEERLAINPGRSLRLLSLPCSTGEEPYSLAMALLEAGVPGERFQIDGIDVSARNIAVAQHATYGRNAFRGTDLRFRDRYFVNRRNGTHCVAELVQRQVRFAIGNLLDPALLPGSGLYDILFCRNVLIYLTRETQEQVLQVLFRLLTPNGLLFVGSSEAGLLQRPDFVWAKMPMAFAFRRADPATIVPPSQPRFRSMTLDLTVASVPRPPHCRSIIPTSASAYAAPSQGLPEALPPGLTQNLEAAERLADQGRLREATQYCEAHLREHGPSPKGFYLLGLIRDASGDLAGAIAGYRRALYLDPLHQEALVHLALLLERRNDKVAARVLQRRISRLAHGSMT